MGVSQRHLANTLEAIADVVPDRNALIHGDLRRTWREFDDRASRLASALTAGGVGVGATVAIAMYNAPEWLETYYATIKIRAIPANINYRYLDNELFHILSDSRASAVVFHSTLAKTILRLRSRLPRIGLWIGVDNAGVSVDIPNDVLPYEALIAGYKPAPRIERPADEFFLCYTGGTTGLPKGVLVNVGLAATATPMFHNMMFGKSIPADQDPLVTAQQMRNENLELISVVAPPLMHAAGLSLAAVPALAVGGTVITLTSASFDPHEVLKAIERHQANRLTIVGDAFARPLVRAFAEGTIDGTSYECKSLRLIASAGVAWSAATKAALFQHIPDVLLFDACGAAEGVTYGTRTTRRGDVMRTGNFEPIPELLLLDEQCNKLDATPGQIGLLASPTVATGYLNDLEKTEQTYKIIDNVLYAIPGDHGRLEDDGSLTLLGRGSAVINTGGEKVHPDEVEDIIKCIDGVDDCLVFGIEDELYGQQVAAMVQLRLGIELTAEQIIANVKAQLAGYKVPRAVLFSLKVPRGPNGKGDYRLARELAVKGI